MSDTLAQLITKIQDLLGDDGTVFDTTLCTASIRRALQKFNKHAPVNAADLIDTVTDQYEYELSDADSRAISILDILQRSDTADEIDHPITFDQYSEDERLFFRLRLPIITGKFIIARYTIPHTINGLDSGTESTVPAWQNETLVVGSAGFALQTRAFARVETINLNQGVSKNYQELSKIYNDEFMQQLQDYARTKRAPVGEPDTRAWNDRYHNWGQ